MTYLINSSLTTFHHLFESQVEQTPEQPAVVFTDKTLSYRELNQKANQLAHFLRKNGVTADTLVGLYVERSLEMLIGILGIFKAGGAYLPLDPNYPENRLKFILQDAQLSILLTQNRLETQLAQLITFNETKLIKIDDEVIIKESVENPSIIIKPHDLAYCIYTSGSTGQPKGVLIEHRGLYNLATVEYATFHLCTSDHVLQFASLNFDASIWEIAMTLSSGATLYLAPSDMLLPGQPLLQFLQQQMITAVTLPPSILSDLSPDVLPNLHTVIVAGEACSPQLIQHWAVGRRFFNGYGPTEITVCATIAKYPENTLESSKTLEFWKRNPPIGYPIANTRVYILDEQLQPISPGIAGELYIAGIGLARGYLNRPDLTAERFIIHPFLKHEETPERLYKTGDKVRYLPDGQLEFLGRMDFQVKIRGFRIELGEIETVIKQFPSVQEAVVIVDEMTETDKRLIAYITVIAEIFEKSLDFKQSLRGFLKKQLPNYMLPATIVILPTFPLTPNGKIDRTALPKPQYLSEEKLTADDLPKTAVEQELLKLWQGILKFEKLSVHSHFFELGGHSLLAVQLLAQITTTLQVELKITDLFNHPTIATLAAYIAGLPKISVNVLIPIQPKINANFPLSSNQRAWWLFEQVYPGTPTYNLPLVYELQGILDLTALEQTFRQIIQRHTSLRTRFRADNNDIPQQSLIELQEHPLTVTDLHDTAMLISMIRQIVQRPFDFNQESLIRIHLLRLTPAKHWLVLTFHHLVIDGWSVKVFLQELMALYTAFKQGTPSSLSQASYQYADFCQWQQHWLQSANYQQQLTYWQTQLQPLPELLELPSEKLRPKVQTFGGTRQLIQLSPQLTTELRQLSQRQGVTLFITLLTAFKVLLYRYTSHPDIVVGTSVAGRQRQEWKNVIGLCMNNLALRSYPVESLRFTDFLAQVRETVLTALQHQDLPLQQLLENLPIGHDLSHNPLFQVFFLMQNFDLPTLSLDGLTTIPLELDPETAKLDLCLELYEREQGLTGWFEYNTALFTAEEIQRMVGHFQMLLTGRATSSKNCRIAFINFSRTTIIRAV
ncbi:MAG: hypothetical protein BWK79_09490 [Beggiatoa sp. IS2]|nr:MAG: hypothetical protein BWK79_09490 [Beggiatoa sp. IS2]